MLTPGFPVNIYDKTTRWDGIHGKWCPIRIRPSRNYHYRNTRCYYNTSEAFDHNHFYFLHPCVGVYLYNQSLRKDHQNPKANTSTIPYITQVSHTSIPARIVTWAVRDGGKLRSNLYELFIACNCYQLQRQYDVLLRNEKLQDEKKANLRVYTEHSMLINFISFCVRLNRERRCTSFPTPYYYILFNTALNSSVIVLF